jgi:class 3 adenylate cyclase
MEQKDYRLAAILYTDIVGFSRMMETDEAGTLKLLAVHNALVEEKVAAHQGTVIKTIGDAYMVSFRNTVQALQSAIEIQDALFEYNCNREDPKLLMRIGLHLGDIYFYENDALGEGINIAARLQSFAKPGCICFSQDVFNQVLNKIDFHAEKLGRVSLKNITKEIHAYEIETKNVEFDHEKTTRNRKITDDLTNPTHGETQPELRKTEDASAKQRDDAAEQNAGWNFETDGQRLGAELNRAFHGLASIAEQKLSGFINSMENSLENKSKNIEDSLNAFSHNVKTPKTTKEFSFEDVRFKTIDKYEKESRGFLGHFITYVAVNAGLWAVNIWTAAPTSLAFSTSLREAAAEISQELALLPAEEFAYVPEFVQNMGASFLGFADQVSLSGFFPWAAIVTCGWGTGLVSHFLELLSLNKTKKELEAIDDLPEEAWRVYRQMDKSRRGMLQHTASAFTTSLLLFVINTITTPMIPWAAIVSGILFLIWLIRLPGHVSAIHSLKQRLCDILGIDRWKDLFSGKNRRMSRTNSASKQKDSNADNSCSGHASQIIEAEKLRDSIISLLRKKGDEFSIEKNTEESLDAYVGQIRLLSSNLDDLDVIIASVPANALKQDRIGLALKMSNTASEELKREYGKSIDEIEKQEDAHRKIIDQREALELRLKSSVSALKRIQMDALRLSVDSSAMASETIFTQIQQDSDELSQYMEDVQNGYQDTKKYLED